MDSTIGWLLMLVLLGAAVGSFLNVCIFRIPQGISIVSPLSHCPSCGRRIRVRDNLPVISYFFLGGCCRDCGARISWRYPLVESATAAGAGLLFLKYGLTPALAAAFLFLCFLIVIAFIDLDQRMIPHVLTLSGIPLFALLAVLAMELQMLDVFLGAMIGAAVLYFVAVYYETLTGREGMGGGDINLLAMLGAFLGWQALPFILLAASFIGSVVGVILILAKGKTLHDAVPFGPFLCLSAALYLYCDRLRLMQFP